MVFDGKWFFISILLLVEVYCRPQNNENIAEQSVESLKKSSVILQPNNESKKIEQKTTDILEKIAEVNKKHGLETRIQKSDVSEIPIFGFPRSQDQPIFSSKPRYSQETGRSNFRFPTSPFSNPILELLEREKVANQEDTKYPPVYQISTRQSQDVTPTQGYQVTSTNHNAEITAEDIIPGQTIKRKIVHQQTVFVPNPNYGLQNSLGFQIPPQYSVASNPSPLYKPNVDSSMEDKYLNSLEKQTISNIRNIMSNSQNQAFPGYYSSYVQPTENNPDQKLYSYLQYNRNGINQQGSNLNDNDYNLFVPYPGTSPETGRQNWNWPGAAYFPVYIKDPFLQIYNAITSMIEYGPNAGMQNPCKKSDLREGKTSDDTKISIKVDGHNSSPQISINGDNQNNSYLDIENIDIGATGDSSLKFTLNLPKEEREFRENDDIGTGRKAWDSIKVAGKSDSLVLNTNSSNARHSSKFPSDFQKDSRPLTVIKNQTPLKSTSSSILSPPSRDPTHQTDEFGDESEEEKSEELISNDNNKKLFSRDNTGSGVFIHKLKVRKGGVAIAGPGGIATAGSGGTAIVGPGGVAYTQPDSLAIAGSGTKVVAVDPTVNLGDLVNNSTFANKTRLFPNSRVGKVVAVGPVVYYNKG